MIGPSRQLSSLLSSAVEVASTPTSTPWLQTANRVLVAIGLALSTSCLAMRIHTKIVIMKKFWWDDGSLSLFLFCCSVSVFLNGLLTWHDGLVCIIIAWVRRAVTITVDFNDLPAVWRCFLLAPNRPYCVSPSHQIQTHWFKYRVLSLDGYAHGGIGHHIGDLSPATIQVLQKVSTSCHDSSSKDYRELKLMQSQINA